MSSTISILVLFFALTVVSTVAALSSPQPAASTAESTSRTFDVVVIGGGSAGLTAAKFASSTCGRSVAIVEKARLGGDCTWTGCVPSKSLIASAKASAVLRKKMASPQSLATDWAQARELFRKHQQEIYDKDDAPQVLEMAGVQTIQGKAFVQADDTVVVTAVSATEEEENGDGSATTPPCIVHAKEGIIVCTGATAVQPTGDDEIIPGLTTVNYVTYEGIWDLERLPPRITVVGGGPIGCELAQALSRLGCNITMVVASDRLLPQEDAMAGQTLQKVFAQTMQLHLGQRPARIESSGGGGHTIVLQDGTTTIEGDLILLSIGRRPNTRGFGLEELGVQCDGGIQVNDMLRTSNKRIYAAGDCTGDRQFTHYAGFQGAIAARNLLLPLSDRGVLGNEIPATTFTSPEVASIGQTEQVAIAELGTKNVGVAFKDLKNSDRAVCDNNVQGFLKVVYHRRTGKILGATIMCPSAGELISEISVMMQFGRPFAELSKVIHPYPSYAIELQLLAADVYYADLKKTMPLYNFLKRIGL